MKVVAIFACICVASSLAGVPLGAVKNAAAVGSLDAALAKAGDKSRDWRQSGASAQEWGNTDVKKAGVARDWAGRDSNSASDANSRAQDWNQEASAHSNAADASNRAAAKAAGAVQANAGSQDWAASNRFDKNQNWADNSGWRKGNKRHEGISYGFDKKFARNANDNGGFDAGSSVADHALDDWADRSNAYDRKLNDWNAQSANADRQNADRAAGFGNNAWANARAADKFGRDADQAGNSNANNRDWAEKRDNALTQDRYQDDRNSRAYDALNDKAQRDSNAGRNVRGFGAVDQNLGKNYGYGGAYGYGVAGKGVGLVGKDFAKAKGASDQSSLWDNAQRDKNAQWKAANRADQAKNSALANHWQADSVKGFNKDQSAALHDHGYAQDASAKDQGANAQNSQWADANAAKAANQASHDLDEVARHRSNNKWRQSDRDHKRNEYKKFFNNDKKGGQNWERLKYNKDQTDDAASADYAKKWDDANRWQDAHRSDDRQQASRGANAARSADAANRQWAQDGAADRAAADNAAAQAAAAADAARWGADTDRRKFGVEQTKKDSRNQDQQAWDRNQAKAGFDSRSLGGVQAAGAGYGGYGDYGAGYGGYGYGAQPYYGGYQGAYNKGYNGYQGYPAHGGVPVYGGYGYH